MKPGHIITDQQGNARLNFEDNGSRATVVQQEIDNKDIELSQLTGDSDRSIEKYYLQAKERTRFVNVGRDSLKNTLNRVL